MNIIQENTEIRAKIDTYEQQIKHVSPRHLPAVGRLEEEDSYMSELTWATEKEPISKNKNQKDSKTNFLR